MSCPTCEHTMQRLNTGDDQLYWCPRCGTLREKRGTFVNDEPPMLPARVRDMLSRVAVFEVTKVAHRTGVTESCMLPNERLGDKEILELP